MVTEREDEDRGGSGEGNDGVGELELAHAIATSVPNGDNSSELEAARRGQARTSGGEQTEICHHGVAVPVHHTDGPRDRVTRAVAAGVIVARHTDIDIDTRTVRGARWLIDKRERPEVN